MLKRGFLTLFLMPLIICLFFIQEVRPIHLSNEVWEPDAGDYLQIISNINKHNTYAFNDAKAKNKPYATNFREPLPVFLWSKSLALFVDKPGNENLEPIINNPQLYKAKYANSIFLAILLVSILFLMYEVPTKLASPFTKTVSLLAVLAVLNWYSFLSKVNSFSNDLHTGAWLCLLMLQFVYYFKKPLTTKLVFIGLVYGLLCLTKATFFYSGIVAFLCILAYQFFNKINIKSSLVVFLTALTVVSPWLLRNYVQTGQTAISGRGPETFVDRTYEEIYNDTHFIGLWYAYSPDFLKPLATKLTGYSFEDRLKGGRLQHSTRAHVIDHEARKLKDESMAINSHFKAGIWMTLIYDAIYAKVKDPVIAKKEASNVYKNFALQEMFKHPLRHVKHTVIFAWRGIWILNAIDGRTAFEMGEDKQEPKLKQLFPFLGFVSMLGLSVYGMTKRQHLLVMMTIFSVAAYGFNSFFSHNLPRYGEQFLPIWLLSLSLVVLWLISKLKQRMIVE